MNWIQFVKKYAKENNITYGKALKQAGPEYRKLHGSTGHSSSTKKHSSAKKLSSTKKHRGKKYVCKKIGKKSKGKGKGKGKKKLMDSISETLCRDT